jgi:hypothetical protein
MVAFTPAAGWLNSDAIASTAIGPQIVLYSICCL